METAFASLPLPLSQPALTAAVSDAETAHVRTWRRAFVAYRGCDEYAAADKVLSTTFETGVNGLDARNAAVVAATSEKALKAALLSYKAALEDAKSPMSERALTELSDAEAAVANQTFRCALPARAFSSRRSCVSRRCIPSVLFL